VISHAIRSQICFTDLKSGGAHPPRPPLIEAQVHP